MDIVTAAPVRQLRLRLENVAASAVVVIVACAALWFAPYHRDTLAKIYVGPPWLEFTGYGFLLWAAIIYVALLAAYFFLEPTPTTSKSLRFLQISADYVRAPALSIRKGLTKHDRLAVLSTLLKVFFGPMMTVWLMAHCMGVWANGAAIMQAGLDVGGLRPFFDQFGYWFLMQVILFVDVLLFTVGYLVESPRLGNEIRSVDPTLLGWAAALLCYPPFNKFTGWVLGSQVSDFPKFDNPTLHLALNLLLLTLMAIYASASVALGLKASNLTHRGIVARGPYAVVRHPAYVCKNMAWWIGAAPLVTAAFDRSLMSGLLSIGSVAAWSMLYALRALTEEDHLRQVDGAYDEYAARVRYRFIPGLI